LFYEERALNPSTSVLLTDLYQLTMLQGYFDQGMDETAVFEFFVRKLPDHRNFLLAAGLEQVMDFLENLHFTKDELDWLAGRKLFSKDFLDFLAHLRFTGEVHAMAEGTVFFPDEPILRVTAPIAQAQLVESRIINLLHFETLIASKAARCVLVAPDKLLVDFGLRRAHGAEAGLLAARASYIAGFQGTATVLAGKLFDIPTYGTMAHSFVQAHDEEGTAFEHFARSLPANAVLLIDTYDTEAAAYKVVELARRLKQEDISIKGVRIDSGDLIEHANRVRRILDAGGFAGISLFASGNLDEYEVKKIIDARAAVDGFGIGTRVDTSVDAPYLDCAYKLEEYGGRPRRKRSEGKATWPGRKQVYRYLDSAGRLHHDALTLAGDAQDGIALVQPVMSQGKRIHPAEPLARMRERAAEELARLPESLRSLLEMQARYPVHVSASLTELVRAVDQGLGQLAGFERQG
jgi:nicotinate phosphoribosyltransferase